MKKNIYKDFEKDSFYYSIISIRSDLKDKNKKSLEYKIEDFKISGPEQKDNGVSPQGTGVWKKIVFDQNEGFYLIANITLKEDVVTTAKLLTMTLKELKNQRFSVFTKGQKKDPEGQPYAAYVTSNVIAVLAYFPCNYDEIGIITYPFKQSISVDASPFNLAAHDGYLSPL